MPAVTSERVIETMKRSLASAEESAAPYRHWRLSGLLPDEAIAQLQRIDFPPVDLGGVSGSREVHNDQRHYFDAENKARFPVVAAIADAFQSPAGAGAVAAHFGADIEGTFLRIEHAQDSDGFWLKPHTDIGVKRFSLLLYVSDHPQHADLGTDIYAAADKWAKRQPFKPNHALAFVPSTNTWHGFEKRPIVGVRKSMILNYVTDEWRAREQLAFPDKPISFS